MSNTDEVARLAADFHRKNEIFTGLSHLNVPRDPEAREKQSIAYHQADAAARQAWAALERAKRYV